MNTLLDDNILLIDKEKQELIDIILKQREKIKELQSQNDELKAEKSKTFAPVRGPLKKRWKKLGNLPGHVGVTRTKPAHIDHVESVGLAACTDCGGSHLRRLHSLDRTHIQEDIVPARVETTKFVKKAYWCPDCRTRQYAPFAAGEIPHGYLGPNVLVHTVLLKYHHGLPYTKIRLVFKELCGLTVTESALAQALQRMSRWLKVEEDQIIEAVRASPHIHADETGWKVAGSSHWLWAFVNERLALYRIRKSRGKIIPREVLKDDYGGVLISDFLGAYNKLGSRRQRCLVHLVREMNKCRENDKSLEYQLYDKKLRRIIRDAKRLNDRRHTIGLVVFIRRLTLLKERLLRFSCRPFHNKNWQRLASRFLRHHDELLTFLEKPGIPMDNNHAERMIRPNVIFRKISRQNMSKAGATAHEVLMSVLQTLRLRKEDPIRFFKEAYLKHRQGNSDPAFAL